MSVNIDLIFKIATIGILVAILNRVLVQSGREEIAMMTTLAGLVIVLLMVIDLINQLFQTIKSIFQLY
ncbi:MAG: stage sporulation protein [Clostridiales bacterium]|jgi:stage III sporulation protein AC|uniref:Stage III sporulation protein AC n=1 Tax=Mahella australiensis (strain DSM 15567 / CIP 107919 / 50-1 BON) TaxID=697281 RepID=F4A171_MAHA5|nr:stage III sporulation protein AC [Mahella australiensis]AEE95974.1 stage III sporulation protein AC [Mahella australiensis 50-1 BON]MDI3508902.1 stage sporulation protein [Clostridiales bacterium]MDK2991342.1 stage sporulation protein [Clostridiales bacterium]